MTPAPTAAAGLLVALQGEPSSVVRIDSRANRPHPPIRADSPDRFPLWLAFYPGAKVITGNAPPPGWQPQTATDMRSYRVELSHLL